MSYEDQESNIFSTFQKAGNVQGVKRNNQNQQQKPSFPESPDEGFEVFTAEGFISNSEEISKRFEKMFRRK